MDGQKEKKMEWNRNSPLCSTGPCLLGPLPKKAAWGRRQATGDREKRQRKGGKEKKAGEGRRTRGGKKKRAAERRRSRSAETMQRGQRC